MLSFETGLQYSSKGFKLEKYVPLYNVSEPAPSSQKIYEKETLNYIEIPLSIKTSGSLLGLSVYGTIGSYVAIGINGKAVSDLYPSGISERKEYKRQIGQDGSWKRFDYGLQAGAGVTFDKYVFELNYSYGLANISQYSPHVEKNRIIGLTLGYKFKTRNQAHNSKLRGKSGFGALLTEN